MDLIGKFKEVDPLVQANWMMKLFNKQYNKSIIIHSQILHIETQWDRNLQFKSYHPNFTISIIQQIPSIYWCPTSYPGYMLWLHYPPYFHIRSNHTYWWNRHHTLLLKKTNAQNEHYLEFHVGTKYTFDELKHHKNLSKWSHLNRYNMTISGYQSSNIVRIGFLSRVCRFTYHNDMHDFITSTEQ